LPDMLNPYLVLEKEALLFTTASLAVLGGKPAKKSKEKAKKPVEK